MVVSIGAMCMVMVVSRPMGGMCTTPRGTRSCGKAELRAGGCNGILMIRSPRGAQATST